jgi:adenosylcobyric acid synthase
MSDTKNDDESRAGQARCLAIFGTASDVGKSVVTTALCRLFRDSLPAGHARVAPFKAQNMSNNSCVTPEGGEMGRAQYVQALAAGVVPHVDMNPVLLKPSADHRSQVVLLGKPHSTRHAASFFRDRDLLWDTVVASLTRLRNHHDLIVIEGAGSCAEVNLRSREIVNFPVAHACDAPVILVADIDRGGVFGQVVGTLDVMPDDDRSRVAGVLINRFRGDRSLFDDGVGFLEKRTGLPVLGVIPFAHDLRVDAEDSLSLGARIDPPPTADSDARLRVAVLHLPHISNATDFDAFEPWPDAAVHFCHRPRDLSGYQLVIVPGSKAVISDLQWLRRSGWCEALSHYHQQGGCLLGVCGGYQMLGRSVRDPEGIEAEASECPGLELLDVDTTLCADKALCWTEAQWPTLEVSVRGYEIHQGVTDSGGSAPLLSNATRSTPDQQDVHRPPRGEGAISADGRVWGTYLHGLFDAPGVVPALIERLGAPRAPGQNPVAEASESPAGSHFDRLASHFRSHLDMDRIMKIAQGQ